MDTRCKGEGTSVGVYSVVNYKLVLGYVND